MCGREDDPSMHEDACPFCGTPGRYVTADEGTSHFAPRIAALEDALKTALREKHEAEQRAKELQRMFSETA